MQKLSFIPQKIFMMQAIACAEKSSQCNEVPVGAVIVHNNEIIGHGRNRKEEENTPLAHAEIEAIHMACKAQINWRLTECELYVTLEPCPMCMGAILNARIKRVIFAVEDFRTGCCGSALNMKSLQYYSYPDIYPGFMEEECKLLLKAFFREHR